jgi:hypothetical protein
MGHEPPGGQSSFPSRAQVRAKLTALAEGHITAQDANDWACPWVVDDSAYPYPIDEPVWAALTRLCGADLKISPDTYLHGDVDYRAWLEEFDQATQGQVAG